MSRVVAIIGILLCVYNGIDKYIAKNTFRMMPIFAIFFLNAARGTFKYRDIMKTEDKGDKYI
ncbi:MAG: hypothetical protein ACLQBQ_10525 [Smithella sp.]